jgi:hypothetical protein
MGATDFGDQTIVHQYYEEATAGNFNKRLNGLLSRGVYSGGYLTKLSNTSVSLSPLVVEIGDDDRQVRVATESAVTLDVSTATPYVVLRWTFVETEANYMDVLAVAYASIQTNDVVVGLCNYSGSTLVNFNYASRTLLDVQEKFLKVIANEAGGLYVWLRAGRIYTGSGYMLVPEQRVGPFVAPSSPNSRIDLVYIDSSGTVGISQGTQAVSPSAPGYGGKLVVAEVLLVNGDSAIPATRITDTRSFITPREYGQSSRVSGSTDILTDVNAWADLPSMSTTITTRGGNVLIMFQAPFRGNAAEDLSLRVLVDGSVKYTTENTIQAVNSQLHVSVHWLATSLSAGSHIFKLQWKKRLASAAYKIYQDGATYPRILSVVEVPA